VGDAEADLALGRATAADARRAAGQALEAGLEEDWKAVPSMCGSIMAVSLPCVGASIIGAHVGGLEG
jgi:hypothetical protein